MAVQSSITTNVREGRNLFDDLFRRGVQWDIELELVCQSGTLGCGHPDEELASDGCAMPKNPNHHGCPFLCKYVTYG